MLKLFHHSCMWVSALEGSRPLGITHRRGRDQAETSCRPPLNALQVLRYPSRPKDADAACHRHLRTPRVDTASEEMAPSVHDVLARRGQIRCTHRSQCFPKRSKHNIAIRKGPKGAMPIERHVNPQEAESIDQARILEALEFLPPILPPRSALIDAPEMDRACEESMVVENCDGQASNDGTALDAVERFAIVLKWGWKRKMRRRS